MGDTGAVAILESGRLKCSRLPPLDGLDPASCGPSSAQRESRRTGHWAATLLLLTSVDTDDEANELTRRFEASGIPVFVEPDYTRPDPASRNASFGYRVHLWLEEQVEDGKRLLADPSYEDVSPVDVDAFYAALQKHDQIKEEQWKQSETRWLKWVAVAIATGIAGWIAYAALRS